MTPDLEQPPFCDIFPHFLNSPAEFTLTIPQVSTQGLLFTTRICPSLAQTAIISEPKGFIVPPGRSHDFPLLPCPQKQEDADEKTYSNEDD